MCGVFCVVIDVTCFCFVSMITEYEVDQVVKANVFGRTLVVFIYGLWLLGSSWDCWLEHFEDVGYVAFLLGWFDDFDMVVEVNVMLEVMVGKGIEDVVDYY